VRAAGAAAIVRVPADRVRASLGRVVVVLVAIVCVSLAAACGSSGGGARKSSAGGAGSSSSTAGESTLPTGIDPHPLATNTTVTVITGVPNEGYAYLYVADALGEFAKENLTVKIQTVTDASTVVPLLDKGTVDFAVSGLFGGLFNVMSSGAYIRFLTDYGEPAHGTTAAGWWQVTDGSSKPSACDLKGKSVGTPAPTSSIVLDLASYLATCNLKTSDVRFVTVAAADAQAALKSNAVQAAYSLEPFTSLIAKSGNAQLVAPQRDGLAGLAVGQLAKTHPEVVQAFVRALVRTSRTYLQGNYRNNPQVLAAITKNLGVQAAVLEQSQPRVFDPNLTLSAVEQTLEPIQQYWLAAGGVLTYKTPIPVDDIVDPSFLNNVTEGS
jgi:NitT/TauT family transport system substrate-binding protein